MTKLDSKKKKKRSDPLANKFPYILSYGFPVIVYGCDSWVIKKNECQRVDAFELCCWRRRLRVAWTVRRSNQSILKDINPEYSLEVLMLKLQHFGYLMWRTNSLEKTLMLGKIEGKRRRGWQRMKWLDSITNSVDMNLSKLREIVKERKPGMLQSIGVAKSQTCLSDWTTTKTSSPCSVSVYSYICSSVQRRQQLWKDTKRIVVSGKQWSGSGLCSE